MDFVTKFEKALRKRYQHLKTEVDRSQQVIGGGSQANFDGTEGSLGKEKEGIEKRSPRSRMAAKGV